VSRADLVWTTMCVCVRERLVELGRAARVLITRARVAGTGRDDGASLFGACSDCMRTWCLVSHMPAISYRLSEEQSTAVVVDAPACVGSSSCFACVVLAKLKWLYFFVSSPLPGLSLSLCVLPFVRFYTYMQDYK
jgi:hypothetical protein